VQRKTHCLLGLKVGTIVRHFFFEKENRGRMEDLNKNCTVKQNYNFCGNIKEGKTFFLDMVREKFFLIFYLHQEHL
jgi:hypothetical protein